MNQPPDVILGQSSPTSSAVDADLGAVNAAGFYGPDGVIIADDWLLVMDAENKRVLGFVSH